MILDDFSALAFGSEWDCVQLSRKAWREQVEAHDFNILFVESAWAGFNKEWFGKLDGGCHEGSELAEIVRHFGQKGIPTVFWNKEDPVHYGDFLAAAKLFDHVFTTDADRIPDYRRDLGHGRVGQLPFAAQPRLHNPIRPSVGWHERDIAFGGMYFRDKFDSRREQMDLLLGAAARLARTTKHSFEIFSRQLGGAAKYQFPEPLNKHVVGSLEYRQMLTAYKAYKGILNINTVTDSSTMCARRVFEVLASGTNVISTSSTALEEMFGPDEIKVCTTADEAEETLLALLQDPRANERSLHLAQRRIWRNHTYHHRCESMLSAAAPDLMAESARPGVTCVVVADDDLDVEQALQIVGSQADVNVELVLVMRGTELSDKVVHDLQQQCGPSAVVCLSAAGSETLGECFNRAVAAGSADVVALMSATDHYGPNYLSDQLYALDYSAADVVGKQAVYSLQCCSGKLELESPEAEHRWTTAVLGSTLTARADVFRRLPFKAVEHDVQFGFLDHLIRTGGRVYSADKFNYLQMVGGGVSKASGPTLHSDPTHFDHKQAVSL